MYGKVLAYCQLLSMGEGGVGEGERGKIDGRLTGDEGITIDPWRLCSCIDGEKSRCKK